MSEMRELKAFYGVMSAINEGVAEMLIRGTELPSINASLRVARSVRLYRAAILAIREGMEEA